MRWCGTFGSGILGGVTFGSAVPTKRDFELNSDPGCRESGKLPKTRLERSRQGGGRMRVG
jgi:hypothetical protein